jgi:hypothetical protein
MRNKFKLLAVFAFLLASLTLAEAQGAIPAPIVYAEQFNNWTLNSQSANTYTFNANCYNSPLAAGISQYFEFGPNANPFPVLIRDANPALSEIVTPSAVSTVSGACGFSASPANQHTSFSVSSGTAGLQDAVTTIGNSALPATSAIVELDRAWYGLVNALPGGVTQQSIIFNLVGNYAVNLVDITTAPFTFYTWNGSHYVANAVPASLPNLKVSSFTAISAPTALSTSAATNGLITTATTGGSIPASATYRLAATYVDAAGGETLISTDSASTATIATGSGTATNTISVTSPAAATGAIGWRLYMTAASGSAGAEILYAPTSSTTSTPLQNVLAASTVLPIGATATIKAIITGTADVPASASAFPRLGGVSLDYPPFAALGTIASAATGTLGVVNFPAGYLNTLGRTLKVCGNGYATTNGTGGTVTLAQTLASVPGVTSITPFTAVSGTIAGSTIQLPINFCVTYTTAATGATGTLEAHGYVIYGVAGTAVGTVSNDFIFTVSSTVDLTKQNQLAVTISPTTAGLTAAQLRQLTIEPLN